MTFVVLTERLNTDNNTLIAHDQQTSYLGGALFAKLMSIYTGI
jgi:hypothetical protein